MMEYYASIKNSDFRTAQKKKKNKKETLLISIAVSLKIKKGTRDF